MHGKLKGPIFRRVVHIDAPTIKVWQALIEPSYVNQYYLCPLKDIDLKVGGKIVYANEQQLFIEGEILEFVKGEKLIHSFQFGPMTHANVETDKATRVSYQIKSKGNKTELTLTHDQFDDDNQTFANVTGGWDIILNGLKELLERE